MAAAAGWGRTLGCCVNVLAAELTGAGPRRPQLAARHERRSSAWWWARCTAA